MFSSTFSHFLSELSISKVLLEVVSFSCLAFLILIQMFYLSSHFPCQATHCQCEDFYRVLVPHLFSHLICCSVDKNTKEDYT